MAQIELDADGRPIVWIAQTPGGGVVGVFHSYALAKKIMEGRPVQLIAWTIDTQIPKVEYIREFDG